MAREPFIAAPPTYMVRSGRRMRTEGSSARTMASSKRERLRALEFYAGVGGFHYSLLRSQVNAEVTGSFDINPTANKIYAHNFPNTAHYNRNICGLTASELDKLEPNIIHMSPPCQPFTRQGLRRDKEDRRTDSFFHLMLTISEMRKPPNYILMENVQGFESSHTRNEFTQTLERVGYSYQEFLLSPVQFGVPNSRLRYYLLAKKKPLSFALKPASEDANALVDFVRQLPCTTETDKGLVSFRKTSITQILYQSLVAKQNPISLSITGIG